MHRPSLLSSGGPHVEFLALLGCVLIASGANYGLGWLDGSRHAREGQAADVAATCPVLEQSTAHPPESTQWRVWSCQQGDGNVCRWRTVTIPPLPEDGIELKYPYVTHPTHEDHVTIPYKGKVLEW